MKYIVAVFVTTDIEYLKRLFRKQIDMWRQRSQFHIITYGDAKWFTVFSTREEVDELS